MWTETSRADTVARAKDRIAALLAQYQHRALEPKIEKELRSIVERKARRAGMNELPRTEMGYI